MLPNIPAGNWYAKGIAGMTTLLPDALVSVNWPEDLATVFFWGGCEHNSFRTIHRILRYELKLPRANQVLYSHWHRLLNEEQIVEVGGEAYVPEGAHLFCIHSRFDANGYVVS
ncbi:SIP domain-containing protein [Ochrobactrum quorumnocens]